MPLSYRNVIDGAELQNALSSGDFSGVIKKPKVQAKYIKGYAKNTALEEIANTLGINKGLFGRAFGLEKKELDAYDPYHTSDAKKEDFWYENTTIQGVKVLTSLDVQVGPPGLEPAAPKLVDGKSIQKEVDENTNTFKRGLFKESFIDSNSRDKDFFYEDPFIPSFELYFDTNSPFFVKTNIPSYIPGVKTEQKYAKNSLQYFMLKYVEIDPTGYSSRHDIWEEFQNTFFKIFDRYNEAGPQSNKNKPYYITSIAGINCLNKKIIKYTPITEADKITVTLNEDIAMSSWYMAELYNNLVYSYRNQRYMFPENLLRFNMIIKINDIRNFTLPYKDPSLPNNNKNPEKIRYKSSPKSQIVYTLHDCNFDFFESKNYGEEITIGGYGSPNTTPSTLSFNVYFKSVTRWSEFPLQNPLQSNSFNDPTPLNVNSTRRF